MTQKLTKGDFRELKAKNFPGEHATGPPLEACAFDARLRNQSVFMLDPCLLIETEIRIIELSN